MDGGPPQSVFVPGLSLGSSPPVFESAGGAAKALYDEFPGPNRINTVVGNEDASGGWIRLPDGFCDRWVGHTALCSTAEGLVLVHGDDVGTVGDHGRSWYFAEPGPRLFFTTPIGLYVVDNPAP